jgi:ABC-2 type transport system ATP-binding protein
LSTAPPAVPLIRAENVARWYGEVAGLNGLSVTIGPGITGLVGPNGAGKSTFLKLVTGELRPSSGAIEVLGRAPFADRALYRKLGFAPQQDALYGDMTGLEWVTALLRLSGSSARDADLRARAALERVGLADAWHRRTRTYSKGMRQRAKLAQAFAHGPELLVADEPMTGLDPLGRHEMTELLGELAREGTSILVSSHVLHEVEHLTREIVLLHRGRLLAQGSLDDVRALLSRHPRKVRIEARDARRLAGALLALECVGSARIENGALALETHDLGAFLERLPAVAAEARAGVASLDCPDASLEAVFDYLVG